MAKTLWAEVRYQHQTQPRLQQRRSSCSQREFFCPGWGSSGGSSSQQSASAVLPMKLRVPGARWGKSAEPEGTAKQQPLAACATWSCLVRQRVSTKAGSQSVQSNPARVLRSPNAPLRAVSAFTAAATDTVQTGWTGAATQSSARPGG